MCILLFNDYEHSSVLWFPWVCSSAVVSVNILIFQEDEGAGDINRQPGLKETDDVEIIKLYFLHAFEV